MADDLKGIEISQVDALTAIRTEQRRVQQLVDKAAELKDKVETAVYERVARDYRARIETLESQAEPLRQQARAELVKLQALHERLSAGLETARLDLQEVEFRHNVGELADEEFTKRQQACQQTVEERSKCYEEAEHVLQRFLDILPAGLAPQVAEPDPRTAEEETEGVTLAAPCSSDDAPPTAAAPALSADPFGTVAVGGARLVEQKNGSDDRSFAVGAIATIGRTPDNDIAIKERAVSRHHARIALTEGGFVITDLNSGNGTFVNGQRISECGLANGDRVELGELCFVFRTT